MAIDRDDLVKQLRPNRHYEVDLKHKSVTLTDEGVDKVEQLAEIPEIVRKSQIIEGYDLAQDKVDAYCDKLTTAAEPLAEKSLTAYSVCLSKSTELGWFSEWSKLCERELGQIRPEEYPTTSELRSEPNQVAPITDIDLPTRLE